MFKQEELDRYIQDILRLNELYIETTRIQKCLVGLHKHPNPNKEIQQATVSRMTQLFQALLLAKETRQKVV